MAALSISKRAVSLFKRPFLPVGESFKSARTLSITSNKSKFFGQELVGKATDAHSKLLTEKDTLYEFECKVLSIRKRLHRLILYQKNMEAAFTAFNNFLETRNNIVSLKRYVNIETKFNCNYSSSEFAE